MLSEKIDLNWQADNQRYLASELRRLSQIFQDFVKLREDKSDSTNQHTTSTVSSLSAKGGSLPAIDEVCKIFGLSPFERDVLLLCAGMELQSEFAALCAAGHNDPQQAYPTFSLALAALPCAHWSATSPASPLRRNRLIEITPGIEVTRGHLRIDERILNYLVGVRHRDQRLVGLIDEVPSGNTLVPSHRYLVDHILAVWEQSRDIAYPPVIQLCGSEVSLKRSIASSLCQDIGIGLSMISGESLPSNPVELEQLIRLWERESLLAQSALLLDCNEIDSAPVIQQAAVARMIERVPGFLIVSSHQRQSIRLRPIVTFGVSKPTLYEQRSLWKDALGSAADCLNGRLERLSSQFDVNDQVIRTAGAHALGEVARISSNVSSCESETAYADLLENFLWSSCRENVRPRIDDLAQRIDARATWDDLILPNDQLSILRDISAHVRHRSTVYEKWGFASKGARGLGISALFAGSSGTGKTMAAEVLARDLDLDLYRIDLSAVVSKYIGESEKNLRRVFDAAEEGGAILLFDEADALFGKRSETKDSHDRYANIEVSYLLQRMECYRGLAILTTNLKKSLDSAFLRRLRFLVDFPFPSFEQRTEIWRRAFPADTPTDGLDVNKLALLTIAGGSIRNAALNAAFYAANAEQPVQMAHCLLAAQAEYNKLEKTLTNAETAGWV